jgi:hypothetical protein
MGCTGQRRAPYFPEHLLRTHDELDTKPRRCRWQPCRSRAVFAVCARSSPLPLERALARGVKRLSLSPGHAAPSETRVRAKSRRRASDDRDSRRCAGGEATLLDGTLGARGDVHVRRILTSSADTAASLRSGSPRRWRRFFALALLCAIAARMALPVAHASVLEEAAGPGLATPAPAGSLHGAQLSGTAQPAAHDPTTCQVCQSLLHAKPAAPPPAMLARGLPTLSSVVPAPVMRAHQAVARTGHPPRAPPLAALSLA